MESTSSTSESQSDDDLEQTQILTFNCALVKPEKIHSVSFTEEIVGGIFDLVSIQSILYKDLIRKKHMKRLKPRIFSIYHVEMRKTSEDDDMEGLRPTFQLYILHQSPLEKGRAVALKSAIDDPLRIDFLIIFKEDFESLKKNSLDIEEDITYKELVSALTIKVAKLGEWKESDLDLNDIRVTPILSSENRFNEFLTQLERPREIEVNPGLREYLKPILSTHFVMPENGQNISDPSEIIQYLFVNEQSRNIGIVHQNLNSCGREATLFPYFAFSLGVQHIGGAVYNQGVGWSPHLLVKETGGDDKLRYAPRSDFSLAHPKFGPLVLVEVQSNKAQSDRWRMLLQAMAACRYANSICKAEQEPWILAIYLDNDHHLQFYYVVFDWANEPPTRRLVIYKPSEPKNLLDQQDSLYVARFFRNLRDITTAYFERFDLNNFTKFGSFENALKSLYPRSLSTKDKKKGSEKLRKCRPARQPIIREGDEVSQGEMEVCDFLVHSNYISVTRSSRKYVFFAKDGKTGRPVTVKHLDSRDELQILQELLAKNGASNGVIELVEVFNERNPNPIIVMPRYVSATTIRRDNPTCLAYGVQLVDAVDFLHQNLICHLDINSSNIVIDPPTKTLRLIDFDLAVRIKGPNEILQGARGTPGEVAPELHLSCFPPEGGFSLRPSEIVPDRDVTFNPVLVDTYAVGYTILSWIGYQTSGKLKPLWDVAYALRVDDPVQRMPLQEAKKKLNSIE